MVLLSMTLIDLSGRDFKIAISPHWISQKRHEIEP